jgi:riboflavin biosynthesis pyrimidine reductase
VKLLERLYAEPVQAVHRLPPGLAQLYDGDLDFSGPLVYANFVTSIDGVVALPSVNASPSFISGKSEADRFVMGLLRAFAQVVLIGAGTLRAEPDHRWTPEFVYPQGRDHFAHLRAALGLPAEPKLAVLTASGDLDRDVPALDGAVIISTPEGARRLRRRGDFPSAILEVPGEGDLDLRAVIRALQSQGMRMVLSEGGPTVIGQLLELRLLRELFLTISPVLLGRTPSEVRPGLAEGVDLLREKGPTARLSSVHRHGSHLFVRYSLAPSHQDGDSVDEGALVATAEAPKWNP